MEKGFIKIYIALTISLFAFSSCSSWLDLKPEDKVTDEQLFSKIDGFRTSLNGIYLDLNNSSLYGGHMLYNSIEYLAQRYDQRGMPSPFLVAKYDYDSDDCKAIFQSIWERYYFLIGNCNKIIQYGEKNSYLFNEENKGLLVGEAYALRAYLHFDLLRLFGPVYSTNSTEKAIPYNLEFKLSGTDILPANKIIELVIKDLKYAKELLKNDPIITKGPQLTESLDGINITNLRTERLNYYAITALMARVWLYAGENTLALEAAREVVGVQEKWFPFVKRTAIVGVTSNPDRIFYTELLFGIKNSKRSDIFTNFYSPDLKTEAVSAKTSLETIFPAEIAGRDWRYADFWKLPDNQAITYRCFHKYAAIESTDYWKDIVPLIRMSEMYYLIAEVSQDKTEALDAMNKMYVNRGLNDVTEIADMSKAVRDEFVKEFYGEGQLFFYYKRLNVNEIMSLVEGKNIKMTKAQYVIPLPKSETDFRD